MNIWLWRYVSHYKIADFAPPYSVVGDAVIGQPAIAFGVACRSPISGHRLAGFPHQAVNQFGPDTPGIKKTNDGYHKNR